MPLINGMKMACEPCIRGHRSTKCIHANERLMVPVKKPGRPLSTCPHLHNQLCGCSNVTAAIPRKQNCHCGTGTSNGTLPAVQPRAVASATQDIPSPTRTSFRVQKGPSPLKASSRRLSFDLANLERMDVGNVNIVPFQSMTVHPILTPNGRDGNNSSMTYVQYGDEFSGAAIDPGTLNPLLQSQYSNIAFPSSQIDIGFTTNNGDGIISNGTYSPLVTHQEGFTASEIPSAGGSCSVQKPLGNGALAQKARSDTIEEPKGGCWSCKDTPNVSTLGSVSSEGTTRAASATGISDLHQYPFSENFQIDQTTYPSYIPQPTIYAYPPSYGSYQHPLQPSEWRKSVMSNMYAQPTLQPQLPSGLSNFQSTSETLENLGTFHTCGCGDGCQCIGCAAHPYNDATKDYVRSAYKMAHEQSPTSTELNNGHTNGVTLSPAADSQAIHTNGGGTGRSNGEDLSSPPSDTSTGEEQTLSASDYFFVNYPFTGDGCGGDTSSCPCGDDCECIGCTIHRLDGPIQPFPSDSVNNGYARANGDGPSLNNHNGNVNGTIIKAEEVDENRPAKSCCG